MKAFKIKQGLYWTGVLDPQLRVFDIIMETKYGTSYNSYLLEGSEKTALFETAKLAFFDEMVEYIESVASVSQIDYLIMDHTEPDHAGAIEKLLNLNPHITIVATGTAIQFLKHIINTDFNSISVSDGMTLSLGDKTLEFLILPNLHWPDSMYTYVPEIKTLFTCDSFGSHYAAEGIVRSSVTDEAGYADATKYYFDCIIGPFAYPYMYNALERIKDLEIEHICCGHGPVLDSHFDQIFGWYREWCKKPAPRAKKLVVMPYVSAYGYTKELSEVIAQGVEDAGAEVRRYDLIFDDKSGLAADMAAADGYLFGTPTILGEALEPVYSLTLGMYPPVFKGRLASAFGSYGWSGEGVPHLIERLKQIRLKVLDGFRVRFKPNANQLADAYDFGYNFGCVLLKKEQKQTAKGARQLVKCLVCGAVFDSSIEECPVCGVGPENFVPAGDAGTGYENNTDRKYLILGGGIAGLEAARAVRERDKTGEITILSDENHLPYNRPMLTKALLSDFSDDQMAVEQQAWFDENSIRFVKNCRVESIDPKAKTVAAGGESFSYDKLVYALGAYSFVPPFKGHDLDKVVSIRTIEDAARVKAMIPEIKTAAVIGGGVLGLEAAWALRKAKLDVTVIEGAPALMARQLNPTASAMIKTLAEDCGVKVYTGANTAEINEEGVVLGDGTVVPAELVIVSTGVRGNLAAAQGAGLAIDRSIVVNEHMETSVPDIYAAGDCAQYNGINYALWSQSVEQGRTAGANAAGDDAVVYETVDGALSFNGMNTSLFAIGDNGSDPSRLYKIVETTDMRRRQYEKYTFDKNRLVGVILVGDTSRLAELTKKVKDHAKFSEVIKL